MGDETPKGWRKTDRTDGPDTISQNSDTVDNLSQEIRGLPDGQEVTVDRSSVTMETEPSVDTRERTPETVATGKSLVSRGIERLPSSPSLQHLRTKMRGLIVSSKPTDESANSKEENKVDFTSPIYQKTPIAAAMQERKEEDKKKINAEKEREKVNEKEEQEKWEEEKSLRKSSKKEKGKNVKPAKAVEKGRGPSLTPSELMDEILERLTSTWKPERALSSLKYMINMFRAIELHPRNEKYRRVFKGRVKFRKYVGTVKSAKLFIQTSGWMEIGSFLLFPLSKNVDEPLRILRKHLRIMNKEEGADEKLDTHEPDRKLVEDQPKATRARPEAKRQHSDDIVPSVKEVKLTVGGKQNVLEKSSENEEQINPNTAIIGERLTELLERNYEDNEQAVYDLIMENPLDDNTEIQGLPNAESSDPKVIQAENDKEIAPGRVQCAEKPPLQDVDILAGTLDNLIDFLGDSEDAEKDSDNPAQETQTKSENVPELDVLSQTLDVLMQGLNSEEEVFEGAETLSLQCTDKGLAATFATENTKEDISESVFQEEDSGPVGSEKDLTKETECVSSWKNKQGASGDLCWKSSQQNARASGRIGDGMQSSHIAADEKRQTTGLSDSRRWVSSKENMFTEAESEPRQENFKVKQPPRRRVQSADNLLQSKSDRNVRYTLQSGSTEDGDVVAEKLPAVPSASRRRPELTKAKSLNELNRADLSMRILEAGKRARMRSALARTQSMDLVTINQNRLAAMRSPPRTTSTRETSELSSATSEVENATADETATFALPKQNVEAFSKAQSLDDLTSRRVEMSLESKRKRPVRAQSAELLAKMEDLSEAKTGKTPPGSSSSKRAKRRKEIAAKLDLLEAVLGSHPSVSVENSEASKLVNGTDNAETRSVDTLMGGTQEGELLPKKPDSEIFKVPEIPIKRKRISSTKEIGRRQKGPSLDNGLSSGSEDEKSCLNPSREKTVIQPRRTRASALRDRVGSSSRSDGENENERTRPGTTTRRSRVSGERSGVSSPRLSGRSASEGEEKRPKANESNSRSRSGVRTAVCDERNGAFSSSEDEQKSTRVRARNARPSTSQDGSRASSASEDEKVKKNLRAARTRQSVSRTETRASSASEDEKNADRSFRAGRTRSSVSQGRNRVSSASEDEKKADKNLRNGRARPSSTREKIRASSASEDDLKPTRAAPSSRNTRTVKINERTQTSSRLLRLSSSEEEGNRCIGISENNKTQTRRTRGSISTESEGEKKPPRRSMSRTSSSTLKTQSSVSKAQTQNSTTTLSNQSGNESETRSSKARSKDISSRTRRTRSSLANPSNISASEDEHRSTTNSTDNAIRTKRTRPRVSGKQRATSSSVSLSSHSASEDNKKQSRRTRQNVSEVKPLTSSISCESDNEREKKKPERTRTGSGISGEGHRTSSLNVSSRDPNEDEMKRTRAIGNKTRPKVFNGGSKSDDEVSGQQGDIQRAGIPTQLLCHASNNDESVVGGELVEKQAKGNINLEADFASETVHGEATIPALDMVTMEIVGEEFPQGLTRVTSDVSLEKGHIPESRSGDLAEPRSSDQSSLIDGISLSKDERAVDSLNASSISSTVSGERNEVKIIRETSDEEGATEIHPNAIYLETNGPTIHQAKLQNGHPTSAAPVERRNKGQRQSRKDVVSLTFEERKQQLFEAANAPPKTAKPANSRRSILQIQNRNGGQLVTNKKGMYEATDEEPAKAKSSKSRYLGFLHRKNKGPGKAADTRRQLPGVHEAIDKKSISDRQHPLLSSALSEPNIYLASASSVKEALEVDSSGDRSFLSLPRNSSGLRRQLPKAPEDRLVSPHATGSVTQAGSDMLMYKSSPNIFEVDDDKEEYSPSSKETKNAVKEGRKSRSPFRLSPLRLVKKKSGSYDLPQMQAKNV